MKKLLKPLLPQKLKDLLKFIRICRPVTKILGSPYKPPNHHVLQLDITYDCNLTCPGCNRSCPQAPDRSQMSIGQIEKLIKESRAQKRRWRQIKIMGGEPTLHPDFISILNLLLDFKKKHLPGMELCVKTNNSGEKVKKILQEIPKEIRIRPSPKEIFLDTYYAFNEAPVDLTAYQTIADFSVGCHIPWNCGIGLNRFGYYPCGNGAGISRVFGIDIGKKKLPDGKDKMKEELKMLCQYCGAYNRFINLGRPEDKRNLSKTWKLAYEAYAVRRPELSVY